MRRRLFLVCNKVFSFCLCLTFVCLAFGLGSAQAPSFSALTPTANSSSASSSSASSSSATSAQEDSSDHAGAEPTPLESAPSPSQAQPELETQLETQLETPSAEPQPELVPAEEAGDISADSSAEDGSEDEVGALEFLRVGGTLSARRGGETVWRLTFAADSGSSTEPLLTEGQLYIGHGNSVLRVDPESGTVQQRWLVSGPVESVERVNELTTAITVRLGAGLAERFSLRENTLQDAVRFGLEPEVFGYLEAEARVADPAERLERDPTNPWLYLAVGLQEGADPEAARATFSEAIGAAQTFYDLAGIAEVLEENGERTLAAEAFDAAMRDFAARGYDPRLLLDPALEAAYNFPLTPLRRALRAGDDIRADFWARNLYLAAPEVEGASEAFSQYAALIADVASQEEQARWQNRAQGRAGTGLSGLDRIASALGGVGWYAALAVLAAILALHLTLVAKYWRPQSADLARARTKEGRANPAARLLAIRYYTISEKLVLVLMFAAVLALASLANWYSAAAGLPTATRSGTLLNRDAQSYLEQTDFTGTRGAFIRAYAAQVAGDEEGAAALLESAGSYPPALNNLGTLSGDRSLYQQALNLDSGLSEARYNLGERQGLFAFHGQYRPGEPVLALPTQADFQNALTGTWNSALTGGFTNPWTSLRDAAPFNLSPILWNALQVLFLLSVLVTVIFIFVPRPRGARNAPRTPLYHLLALLVPGSGSADEAWGIFLLVPWAVIGLDLLAQLANWPFGLGIGVQSAYTVLGVIYLINTVAFFTELYSYRQRMRALERERGGRTVLVTGAPRDSSVR